MNRLHSELLKKIKEHESVVLATIIQTQGSAPQVPGASALFSRTGLLEGTLGGGILEAASQSKAAAALESGKSAILDFDLTSGTVSAEEAICGGKVRILLDAAPQTHLDAFEGLDRSWKARSSGILMTSITLDSDTNVHIEREWTEQSRIDRFGHAQQHILYPSEIKKALEDGRPGLLHLKKDRFPGKGSDQWLLFEPFVPFPRLVIAGAGHVGRAVAHLGSLLQFEVTVIDDRAEYANRDRIPDADSILVEDIPRAVANFPIAEDTYVVIVTRGHSFDTETLRTCISSPAAYIGMIGSRRKVGLIRENFLKEGWSTAEEFDRVYTPIGLEIHSKTVEEIAVSIAAQLVLVRNEKKGPGKRRPE